MEFNYYLNDEGCNKEGFQYVVNMQDLDCEVFSTDDLIEEIKSLVGDENIDSPADNFYLICCKTEKEIYDVEQVCKKYEDIFIEEDDTYNSDYENYI